MKKKRLLKLKSEFTRRKFLYNTAGLLGGTLLSGASHATDEECKTTQTDILGPFYRFGSPFKAKLAGPEEPGERLILTGTVYSSDCKTPLPGALIEIWQANDAGQYDVTKPANFTEKSMFHLRGMLYTDAKGQYEIETIIPGRYPIPPDLPGLEGFGGTKRPAHIHFRVLESLHVPITTQLYFKGDPYIADDPWAANKPSLAIDLKDETKLQRGVFNFVLPRAV